MFIVARYQGAYFFHTANGKPYSKELILLLLEF